MRLLLVAPRADRDAVGETQLAYQWVSRLAKRHDVTILSLHQPGRPLAPQVPEARVIEWPEPELPARFERFTAMVNPGYLLFRGRARRWIREAAARGERFDLAHQINPVSLRFASPLTGSGIPYVIGPVGGSLSTPAAFEAERDRAPWFTALRSIDGFRLRHDRRLRQTFAEAACVIGIADYVHELLTGIPLHRFRTLSDIGIDTLPPASPGSDRTESVRFLYIGRVVRTKGVRDAVRALGLIPRGLATLDVVGDGYDRAACEQLAQELGLGESVRFHGRVPHAEVASHYADADAFLFPSYREAGGIVVVEAMSHGLPVIVADRGGPATTVDDASGIRVPVENPEQYAQALADAVLRLAREPLLRKSMGAAGRQRTRDVSLWDRRVEWMEALYDELTGARQPK